MEEIGRRPRAIVGQRPVARLSGGTDAECQLEGTPMSASSNRAPRGGSSPADPSAVTDSEVARPSGLGRRAHERFAMELDVSLQILIPEETFQPRSMKAKTQDISVRGMKLLVPGLSRELYAQLISAKRYARVGLTDPKGGDQLKVSGLIVWYDYHRPEKAQRAGDCLMGIDINESVTGNLDDYIALVERNTQRG